jgi:hypothetical protein
LTPRLDAITLDVCQFWKSLAKRSCVVRESVGLPPGIDLCYRTGGTGLLNARQAGTFSVQPLFALELFSAPSCVLRGEIVCDGACFERAEHIAQ